MASDVRASLRSLAPLAFWLAVVGMITLRSDAIPDNAAWPLDPYCLVCGGRGAADATLNVLLFLPLGFAAARRFGWARAALFGFTLSASIELAQATIPGRFPTVGDIVWNGSGATLGAVLEQAYRKLPGLSDRRRAAVAALVLALPLLPTPLMARLGTEREYFAQWAPLVASGESYQGRVVSAEIGGIELPRGRSGRPAEIRSALRRGLPLRVSFVPASPPDELAHVFVFVDSGSDEIASLAVREHDLVWTERRVASALSFETPSVAWLDALADPAPGPEVSVVVREEKKGSVCMERNGRERCGLFLSAGDGWQLLINHSGSRAVGVLAPVLWLGIPGLVAGLSAGGRLRPTAFAATFGMLAAAATSILPFVGLAPIEPLTLGCAVVAGSALSPLRRGRSSHPTGTRSAR